MKKVISIIIFFLIVLAVIIILIINQKNKKIEIPDNPNLKISIDYVLAPTLNYYFYEDTIIEKEHGVGNLPSGPVETLEITKYYFKERIDLTELNEFLNKCPKKESGSLDITLKNGESYDIDFNEKEEILEKIKKIIDQAYKKEYSTNKN